MVINQYPKFPIMQSQLISIYIEKWKESAKEKMLDEAEQKAKEFSEYLPIQSQLITIYMLKGEYDKAEKLAKRFPNYAPIQSQLVTIYIKNGKMKKRLKLLITLMV